jgi:thymidylate synthase
MRSNDVYIGLPFDVFSFTMLQELLARDLGVEVGRYVHMVGSLHLYERNRTDVEQFLAEGWQSTDSPMPPMPTSSPWDGVRSLLLVEEQLRNEVPITDIVMPDEPYWEDLARVLARRAAVIRGDTVPTESVSAEFHSPAFSDFS